MKIRMYLKRYHDVEISASALPGLSGASPPPIGQIN
jgi:hypothetical protein